MDAIQKLEGIDWFYVFLAVVLFLVAVKFLAELVKWFLNFFGIETKGMRQKREDRELLNKTSENLLLLQAKHDKDEKYLEKCLADFVEESRKENEELRSEMRRFTENRTNDREKSREIQKELTASIKTLTEANSFNSGQIDNLMVAQREVLADRINAKYKHYISINGIPEDEVDEFVNLHAAYKGCGGNSSGDAKFDYCINHLPVIPVETKLVIKHE